MDALSDVLHAVKLAGAVFLDAEFRAPWSLFANGAMLQRRMPSVEHFVHYHYIASGRCHARTDGGAEMPVRAGQVLVLPHGDAHVLASAPQLAPISMESVFDPSPAGALSRVNYGGEGDATRVVCGFLACDPRLCGSLLQALPPLMAVDIRQGPSGDWLERSILHSLAEAGSHRAGSQALLARLSEVLFVETLRRYIEGLPPAQTGWFAGLRDPLVGTGLALLHARAAHAWTVEELAREAGCSRSVLAERFKHYVGVPPMQYLAQWRLALAASLLRHGNARVGEVAEQVGFESETAFNRAFKRAHGVAPHRWRQQQRDAGPPTPAASSPAAGLPAATR